MTNRTQTSTLTVLLVFISFIRATQDAFAQQNPWGSKLMPGERRETEETNIIENQSEEKHGIVSAEDHDVFIKGSEPWLNARKRELKEIMKDWKNQTIVDARLRPDMQNSNRVYAQVEVVGLGPVNDLQEEYTVVMFFRLMWYDSRLTFNKQFLDKDEELRLSSSMLRDIWSPDIYFQNSKYSHLHNATTPNILLRIRGDGKVTLSQRISVTAKCDMNFENFPMDVHTCALKFSSYQYRDHELDFKWNKKNPVKLPSKSGSNTGFRLLQFALKRHTHSSMNINLPTGNYSTLVMCFQFERFLGYYIVQTYLPCILIVILSQVSFWINKEATPARMTYGSMTVLALTMLSISERQTVPKVSYVTGLDYFVTTCFGFCFSALLEFAIVNHFTIIRPKKMIDSVCQTREKVQKAASVFERNSTMRSHRKQYRQKIHSIIEKDFEISEEDSERGKTERMKNLKNRKKNKNSGDNSVTMRNWTGMGSMLGKNKAVQQDSEITLDHGTARDHIFTKECDSDDTLLPLNGGNLGVPSHADRGTCFTSKCDGQLDYSWGL